MAYDRPSWKDIDRTRDGSVNRHKREHQAVKPIQEHSTRYAKYKADLDRLFDQGLAGELLKKLGRDSSGTKPEEEKAPEPAKKERVKKSNRLLQVSSASGSRLKLMRAVVEAEAGRALITALDVLVAQFGLPDDWEILVRTLEHPDETLILKALERLQALLPVTPKVPRRFTLKERLRSISQTASRGDIREAAGELEQKL